jgi:putative protein-disulfide isomerase
VIQRIKQTFCASEFRLVLTPFRIDTAQPMDDALRNYVLGQWQKVHQSTGQAFDFRFSVPVDFIYNTRLVCLAIKAFSKQLPEQELEYFHTLQNKFYTENKDLTNQHELVNIASEFQLDAQLFKNDLYSDEIVSMLEQDFELCEKLVVSSYPTLMMKRDAEYTRLASGYTSYAEVIARIDSCLKH